MADVKWTAEQQDAIYEKNSNILVAAAAGSGKTAVLVERIINKIINEKIDIDRLLVVTFTNAAASEMRERVLDAIYKKLEETPDDENLQRQITLLGKASICTIDSFCLDVVRNNFFEFENLSPNFRIGDTTEIELLKQDILEDMFEKKYEEKNEDFLKLIDTYTSYRDDTPLKDLILKIYQYIQSNPSPEKWLDEKVEMFNISQNLQVDFSNTPWGKNLLKEVEEEVIDDISALEKVEENLSYDNELEIFKNTITNDIKQLQNLKDNLYSWDKAYMIIQNIVFDRWPGKRISSEVKNEAKKARDDIKDKLKKVLSKILLCDSEEANHDIYDMYFILKKLERLVLEFGHQFKKSKREKNMVDFNDVEHLALSILIKQDENGNLEKTDIAKKYQNKYEEIAIDEYQDSNLVQEYILNAVSRNNNIFMVGDVKQSIYKFRQAMPELFLNKYFNYSKKEERNNQSTANLLDLKIQLFKNFRSKKNILKFTNIIFQNIMSQNLGDIEYNKEEYLNLGASYPEINQNENIEINVLSIEEQDKKEEIEEEDEQEEKEEDEERLEDIQLEARYVANKIKKMIDNKVQVYDKKEKQYRDIKCKDIVILLRATSNAAPVYEQELINLGISVFSDSSQEYLDSIEIQTIMSLLKIIDNPIQDIPLVTVLRSTIGGFSDNELIEIRLADKNCDFYTCMEEAKVSVGIELRKKIERFFEKIEKWREEQEYMALDELIWKIYSDTGYYNYVGLMPNGELRQANLKMLFERAKQYESASFKGLYNFIHFIEKISLSSGDLSAAKIIGENENVVRIMSIHKSKGLEFPVVFLSNTGKGFNLRDLNSNVLLHQELGIGVKYINYEKQVQYDTLSKAAVRNQVLVETLSEEMRILYVALTRAKEKLIITGIKKNYEKDMEKMQEYVARYSKINGKINPILIKKYKKYIDWILLVYLYNKDFMNQFVDFNVIPKKEAQTEFKNVLKEPINVTVLLEEKSKKLDLRDTNYMNIKRENEQIDRTLNYKYKYVVATTIPTKTSVSNIKQSVHALEQIDFEPPKFIKTDTSEKLTPAQKGTLLHNCFKLLNTNVDYTREKMQELVQNLVQRELITQVEAENINVDALLEFTKSKIWKNLKSAKEVYREKPFYINLKAADIYKEETEEEVLVQGIIDLYYIDKDEKLILVDYKTDFVKDKTGKELIDKYKEQLELYKMALEQALERKVDKILIYSTSLKKEIEL